MAFALSASVRQNLASLQSTASLLSQTQNRLSTGKKVNSALDNPTNFFTAQALDSRAGDISNLLDGVGNGVKILQAADKGLTSLQKLVDSAKSIANQALQSTAVFTSGSSATFGVVSGATASNLLAVGPGTATANSTALEEGAGTAASGATLISALAGATTAPTPGQTLTINGVDINFVAAGTGDITGDVATGFTVELDATLGDLATDVFEKITGQAAGTALPAVPGDTFTLTSSATITASGTALASFGFAASTAPTPPVGLDGKDLTIAAVGVNGTAVTINFGTDDAADEVNTLTELNAKLADSNLKASIDSAGVLTIKTTGASISDSIDVADITGTAVGTGPLGTAVTADPVQDANALQTRNNLVKQFNDVIGQINTTAQDSSFNGVNLLKGDELKLVFNETGTSTLNIDGVDFGADGLGLTNLNAGATGDFGTNAGANAVLDSLTAVSNTLRSQASAFGSNLSLTQIRQDFSKSLIDVLKDGAANLTLADINEEAATSAAASTRQQIGTLALSQATQQDQGVLRLLQ